LDEKNSIREAENHFNIAAYRNIQKLEHIFIEEGKETLFIER
jgi:hypothetical protein